MLNWQNFRKPQRYLAGEWNVIKKSHSNKTSICLCYPDLYEIGMSNLGLRIVYAQLNSFNNIVCERAFMPDDDLYEYLLRHKKKLFSLETMHPLSDFEILGFNFSYELNFTNFLAMLSCAGIKLRARQRQNIIVLGGGIANPESLAEFVDVFFLGEFEETASSFVAVLKKYKDKEARLKALAQIEGFYIPSFYNIYFHANRYIVEKNYKYAKLPVRRVFVKDLNNSFYPDEWLTPHTSIIHDRAQIEIARGCPNQCFFCQARALFFPYRQKSPMRIMESLRRIYKTSGYEEMSLLALSASNYYQIEELIGNLTEYCLRRRIALSLPSLRIEDVVGRLYKLLARTKVVSATLAVESATQRMRDKINKKIDVGKLKEIVLRLKTLHTQHIKLYFMFGFPFETDDDLLAIGYFVRNVIKVSKLKVNLSVNVFIPKPFSYFENLKIQNREVLFRKKGIILSNLAKRSGGRISISNINKSLLEAAISRADRNFSHLLYEAYSLGKQFDGYQDRLNDNVWAEAAKRSGVNLRECLLRNTDNFPWSHIQIQKL